MGFDRAQAKRSVKQAMRMTHPRPMLVTLLFMLMVSVSTGILNSVLGFLLTGGAGDFSSLLLGYVSQGYEVEAAWERAMMELLHRGPGFMFGMFAGGTVLSIIVSLWQGLLNVGYEGYALSMARRENPQLEKLFCWFHLVVPALVTSVLTGVFVFLWALLVSVAYVVVVLLVVVLCAALESEVLMVVLMLAATAAYAAGVVWVSLRYALVDYVLLDKGLSGMDAIREGKRLMKGRVKDAFVLQLSFLGWYLLMVLIIYLGIILAILPVVMQMAVSGGDLGRLAASGGIALVILLLAVVGFAALSVWLRPYVTGCMAMFYDWAVSQDGPSGFGGAGFGGGSGWSQPTDYTWNSGPSSGVGTGSGPSLGSGDGGSAPPPPRPPRDDPWN